MTRPHCFCFFLTCFATLFESPAICEDSWRLAFSGKAVDGLPKGTKLEFWSPSLGVVSHEFPLSSSPVNLPASIREVDWNINFVTPRGVHAFSISVLKGLYGNSHDVEIHLDAPNVEFAFIGDKNIRLTEEVNEFVCYRSLPCRSPDDGRHISPKPPVLRAFEGSLDKKIYSGDMTDGCMGSRWWNEISSEFSEIIGTATIFGCEHHSDGVFGVIKVQVSPGGRTKGAEVI